MVPAQAIIFLEHFIDGWLLQVIETVQSLLKNKGSGPALLKGSTWTFHSTARPGGISPNKPNDMGWS
jgi:hypothetical protein